MPHPTVSQEEAEVWLMPVFIAKEGHEATLQEALAKLESASRKDAGCLEYTVFSDDHRPGAFVLFEGWASREDLKAHNEEDHVKEFVQGVECLLAVPFSVTPITPLTGASS
ncbi:quinol monooxygenase YgiN [Pseudarthrobacter siccitolerans]|uniref:Quinol monooxygenase YgiN n=1 Tax=Pseudarthrobacter siccitolerans TaxID=861266 RepID=A0ABU0PQ76_9MICC|nr:putative quinol monooxygenase [Pseudarthrobacter siccitolerans]MDQ0676120.1 quinol monooxygenase YgiN [Pseudarthrobacter siccitolerans]